MERELWFRGFGRQKGNMKFGARELGWVFVGLIMGVVVTLWSAGPASRPKHHSPAPTTVQEDAVEPDAATQRCLDTVLAAAQASDYDQFVSVADDGFRRVITPTAFDSISRILSPRMQGGFTPTYLGEFRQKGGQVSLWRLAFADGGDDRLARLSMSGARVSGFLITPAF